MKSSDCRTINQEAVTHHREKYNCGVHFHTILWRAKVCVFSQRNEKNSQRRGPFGRYLQVPELLMFIYLLCFLHSSQLFSDASKSEYLATDICSFTSKFMKWMELIARKQGKTLKGSSFHHDLRKLTGKMQRRTKFTKSEILGKSDYFIFPQGMTQTILQLGVMFFPQCLVCRPPLRESYLPCYQA